MMNRFNLLLIGLSALLLSACNIDNEPEDLKPLSGRHTLWVFAQFNIPDEEGTESYYYYGRISKKLYQKIRRNQLNSGFVLLENIHYWGTDDLIYTYKDQENTGDRVFRIEDLRSVRPVSNPPVAGLGVEQYDDVKPESLAEVADSSDAEDNTAATNSTEDSQ